MVVRCTSFNSHNLSTGCKLPTVFLPHLHVHRTLSVIDTPTNTHSPTHHTPPHTHTGGVIMLVGFLLFESQFIHVVSITFTALVLTELLMVALKIRTWHFLMVLAEVVSVVIYILSLFVLKDYFGESR